MENANEINLKFLGAPSILIRCNEFLLLIIIKKKRLSFEGSWQLLAKRVYNNSSQYKYTLNKVISFEAGENKNDKVFCILTRAIGKSIQKETKQARK